MARPSYTPVAGGQVLCTHNEKAYYNEKAYIRQKNHKGHQTRHTSYDFNLNAGTFKVRTRMQVTHVHNSTIKSTFLDILQHVDFAFFAECIEQHRSRLDILVEVHRQSQSQLAYAADT